MNPQFRQTSLQWMSSIGNPQMSHCSPAAKSTETSSDRPALVFGSSFKGLMGKVYYLTAPRDIHRRVPRLPGIPSDSADGPEHGVAIDVALEGIRLALLGIEPDDRLFIRVEHNPGNPLVTAKFDGAGAQHLDEGSGLE